MSVLKSLCRLRDGVLRKEVSILEYTYNPPMNHANRMQRLERGAKVQSQLPPFPKPNQSHEFNRTDYDAL